MPERGLVDLFVIRLRTLRRAFSLLLAGGLLWVTWQFLIPVTPWPPPVKPVLSGVVYDGDSAQKPRPKGPVAPPPTSSEPPAPDPHFEPAGSAGESGNGGLLESATVPTMAGLGGGTGGGFIASLGEAEAMRLPATAVSRSGADRSFYAWPLRGEITSYYGPRDSEFHTGIDIAGYSGDDVRAARAGTVVEADWRGGYGLVVVIDHGDGTEALYSHHSRLYVDVGESVQVGDLIAAVGSTGHSTGPHLHFEIIVDGVPIDPLPWLGP